MKHTAIVIGSNCVTGAHIVDALLEDGEYKVIGVSRSPQYKSIYLPYAKRVLRDFRFIQLDITSGFNEFKKLCEDIKPTVIINVAALSEVALSNERPVEYFDVNTTGVVRLCDYLRRQEYLKHYIHISSAEILGSCSGAVDEEALFSPNTPYAVSKAAADMYINNMIKNFNFPATLIRSTNIYGKHQQLFKIIPRTSIYLKLDKALELHGGGTAKKSFIHIDDVVQGLMLALKRRAIGTFHFSVDSDINVRQIVELICELEKYDFDSKVKIVGERLGQDHHYWLNCNKAKEQLGWKPNREFKEGVMEALEWVHENWSIIQNEPLEYIHKVETLV